MYSNAVLNLLKNPRNAGRISKPDGIADLYNEENNAHVEFSLRIEDGIITNCQFRAQANPYIIAICSTMTNMIKGKMVSMLFLDPYSIKKELGDESPIDIMFCIDCVRMAILDYKEKLEKQGKEVKVNEAKDEVKVSVVAETPIVEEPKQEILIQPTQVKETESDEDDDFDDFFDFFDDI